VYCDNGEEELYYHANDPYEWYNLAQDANYDELPKAIKQAADANVEERRISIAQIMNFQIHICGKY